jgi:hypothetical protein
VSAAEEDPYRIAGRHLQLASRDASEQWSRDVLEPPWAGVVEAIGLALMGLPIATIGGDIADMSSLEHVQAAHSTLALVPPTQRRIQHALDLAYIEDIVKAVEEATSTQATPQ